MVKEIDGYKVNQEITQQFDSYFAIASDVFKEPKYFLHRVPHGIDVFIDLFPENKEGPKSLPPAVDIRDCKVVVSKQKAYEDAKIFSERLEKKLNETSPTKRVEVTLETIFNRDSS